MDTARGDVGTTAIYSPLAKTKQLVFFRFEEGGDV